MVNNTKELRGREVAAETVTVKVPTVLRACDGQLNLAGATQDCLNSSGLVRYLPHHLTYLKLTVVLEANELETE
jgi:hypothetical protein